MKTQVMTITPKKAQELLEGNKRNRPVRKSHVRQLAEEMKAGKWVVNGVPIIFNGKLLIDGQHRLLACVESGKPFETLVVSDVAPNSFLTIDVGRKRTAADTLATRGEENYSALAAAAYIVEVYYSKEFGDRFTSKTRYSNRAVADAMKSYVALPASVSFCVPLRTKTVPISIMSATHYIFSRIDHIRADDFIRRMATGENVKSGTPMAELRARLVENYTSIRKHSRGYLISLIIKAWNAERTGREIKRLRGWTSGEEQFPIAV